MLYEFEFIYFSNIENLLAWLLVSLFSDKWKFIFFKHKYSNFGNSKTFRSLTVIIF